jgi:hypothetical protein
VGKVGKHFVDVGRVGLFAAQNHPGRALGQRWSGFPESAQHSDRFLV